MSLRYATHRERVRWLVRASLTHTDRCIPWPFAVGENGYGQIYFMGRKESAHIVMLLLLTGRRPGNGLETRHLCGDRRCVNYRHLRLGTHQENEADKKRHGRFRYGEQHPAAKLTAGQVEEIRSAIGHQRTIAARFGISQGQVSRIRRGVLWNTPTISVAEGPE